MNLGAGSRRFSHSADLENGGAKVGHGSGGMNLLGGMKVGHCYPFWVSAAPAQLIYCISEGFRVCQKVCASRWRLAWRMVGMGLSGGARL